MENVGKYNTDIFIKKFWVLFWKSILIVKLTEKRKNKKLAA